MNRRGALFFQEVFDIIWKGIPRLFMMVVIMLSIVFLISNFIKTSLDIDEAHSQVLAYRFIFSPACVIYTDGQTNLPSPAVIDLDRFKPEILDSCLYFGERNDIAAALLTLKMQDKEEEILYNEKGYKLLEPKAGSDGQGGAHGFFEQHYVLVKEEEVLKPALLTIKLITVNT